MISQNALAQIIQHNAKTLCSKQGEKMLNEYAGKAPISNGGDLNPDDYTDEWDNWNFDDPNSKQPTSSAPSMRYNEATASKSTLPDAIKKSMLEHQIATPAQSSTAFLDDLGNGNKQNVQPRKQQVNEQVAVPQAQSVGLDYNYIKYLIKECLNEYFQENKVLNENANGTLTKIGLSNGKIKLIDNKGNIFSAELQHQGNIKDKKN